MDDTSFSDKWSLPEAYPKETERENGSGKKKNICVGELTPATKISNQDTLMRSIASNISPSPSGIKAISFEHLSGFVYVLEIPQSLTPPHQVSNEGKYYIRLERDAKPAPHGIVEALFQKRQKPNLTAGIGLNTKFHFPDSLFVYFDFTNESLISAESIGYIIDIYGIRKVKSFQNVYDDFDFQDEVIRARGIHSSQILVKGIGMNMEFEVDVTMDFLLIGLGYYCKDCQLEQRYSIFDLNSFSFSHTYTSKESDNEFSVEEIFTEYQRKRVEKLKKYLDSAVLTETKYYDPLSKAEENIAVSKLKKIPPTSYLDFLRITNGFYCKRKNNEFSFYSLKDICDSINRFSWGEEYLTIGESTNMHYILDTSAIPYSFSLMPKDIYAQAKFVSIGETFFDILDSISLV